MQSIEVGEGEGVHLREGVAGDALEVEPEADQVGEDDLHHGEEPAGDLAHVHQLGALKREKMTLKT